MLDSCGHGMSHTRRREGEGRRRASVNDCFYVSMFASLTLSLKRLVLLLGCGDKVSIIFRG